MNPKDKGMFVLGKGTSLERLMLHVSRSVARALNEHVAGDTLVQLWRSYKRISPQR